jgi:hypothetical protein
MNGTALILAQDEYHSYHSSEGRYEIPDDAWDMDELGRCAEFHHRFIHKTETLLTPSYWSLGRALELLHAKLTVRQFRQFRYDHGIHKVRASKARAIARFYPTPEELAGISVHDAYQAAIKNRREQEPPHCETPQEEACETDPPETSPAATPVAATIIALNELLKRLAKDLACQGIGPNEPHAWVVAQLDNGIEMLLGMKTKIQK